MSSDVLPEGTVHTDLGMYNRKWRTLWAAELAVENLVISNVMATIGGSVKVAPTSALEVTCNPEDTFIIARFHDEAFVDDTFIYFQGVLPNLAGVPEPQFEAMKITGAGEASGTGWMYPVIRNLQDTSAHLWEAGSAFVSLGKDEGDGYIDLASYRTIYDKVGPTITVYARPGIDEEADPPEVYYWDTINPVATMGNLEGFADYATTSFGFAAGNDLTLSAATGFSGFSVDPSLGMRLVNTDLELYVGSTKTVKLDNEIGLGLFGRHCTGQSGWLGLQSGDGFSAVDGCDRIAANRHL